MRGRFDTTDTAGDFSHLRDHRRAEGKLYPLPQILVFCLLAMLAGASSYRKMHEFIMVHFRRLSMLFPSKMVRGAKVWVDFAFIRNVPKSVFKKRRNSVSVVPVGGVCCTRLPTLLPLLHSGAFVVSA